LPLRTPTLPPATHTNCYLLGKTRLTVVEPASPWKEEQQALVEALDAWDGSVERIFLTHHHVDHVGGVDALRAHFDCPVVAHPRTRLLLEGMIQVDEVLDEGETLTTDQGGWDVLHTPGHATGHLCLANRRTGDFVVGDMVAGEGTIVLDPPEGHLQDYLDSLQRLRDERPGTLHPAHGEAIPGADAKLLEYIEHRHMRSDQVRESMSRLGAVTPLDLVPGIYPDLPRGFHPVAERQVLCHLQWLEGRGEARNIDGTWELV